MATVLSVHTSDGCVGRCDARCHKAKGRTCKCICGGANHGVSGEQAAQDASEMGVELLRKWQKEHSDIGFSAVQLPLPL